MKSICAMLLLLTASAFGADLAPFTSDGCSSFPDGTAQKPTLWLHCCIRHDFAYWMGGTEAERLHADEELQRCVADTGEKDIANLMFQGVRAGGGPMFPTPYRWGYGWPLGRGYQAMTADEIKQVQTRLAELADLIHTFSEALQQREAPDQP